MLWFLLEKIREIAMAEKNTGRGVSARRIVHMVDYEGFTLSQAVNKNSEVVERAEKKRKLAESCAANTRPPKIRRVAKSCAPGGDFDLEKPQPVPQKFFGVATSSEVCFLNRVRLLPNYCVVFVF